MAKKPVLRFDYSFPYERTLAKLGKIKIAKNHDEILYKKEVQAQKIWNKYEKKAFALFGEIYKIKILEKFIKAYISLIVPGSFSDPLTISIKRFPDIENNARSKRAFVYVTIHELAHYFAYSRPKNCFFN